MTKTMYKKLIKEVKKIEGKSYSNGYSQTKELLDIASKLDVNFNLGKTIPSYYEVDYDSITVAYFDDVVIYLYNKCNNYINEKIVKIIIENN